EDSDGVQAMASAPVAEPPAGTTASGHGFAGVPPAVRRVAAAPAGASSAVVGVGVLHAPVPAGGDVLRLFAAAQLPAVPAAVVAGACAPVPGNAPVCGRHDGTGTGVHALQSAGVGLRGVRLDRKSTRLN